MTFANLSLVGRLVRQPEMTCFNSGRSKTTFTVAINHPGRKLANGARTEGIADFIRIEAWGKLAEIAHKYLAKGNQVTVCGPFRMDKWVDREGKERMTPMVEAQYLALPPRLRVLNEPEEPSSPLSKPISGEMDFSDVIEHEIEEEDPDNERAAPAAEEEDAPSAFKSVQFITG